MKYPTLLAAIVALSFLSTQGMEKNPSQKELSTEVANLITHANSIISNNDTSRLHIFNEPPAKEIIFFLTNIKAQSIKPQLLALQEYNKHKDAQTRLLNYLNSETKLTLYRCLLFTQIHEFMNKLSDNQHPIPSIEDYTNYQYNDAQKKECIVAITQARYLGISLDSNSISSPTPKHVSSNEAAEELHKLLGNIQKLSTEKRIYLLEVIAKKLYEDYPHNNDSTSPH